MSIHFYSYNFTHWTFKYLKAASLITWESNALQPST